MEDGIKFNILKYLKNKIMKISKKIKDEFIKHISNYPVCSGYPTSNLCMVFSWKNKETGDEYTSQIRPYIKGLEEILKEQLYQFINKQCLI